ncbi:glutathione S-transferase family protein [Calothrix sp. FACHB-1219]|uniref:glutathione S-transferase family protein n=1 Tax=unclassified Calothrix TaxID=2619626 RepID=UPI001683C28C|nr:MULTISPECIES: glutathione S-transferase family protein [unclassified Calothrix]MBD2203139.1 glutathione S-transferase family protein [Calothrix sp. FACHB-168]MBD2218740.1 glutathione S-transferase family protein [Calothrix sp. FACHB-1219]
MTEVKNFQVESTISTKKKGKSLPPKLIIQLGRFVWTTMWQTMMSKIAPRNKSGEYIRPSSQFRNSISSEKTSLYPAVTGRYHLYVGLSCPWAHRTLILRALKGLEDAISVTVVVPSAIAGGWIFDEPELDCASLAQLYQLAQPGYNGRATVPVLWDKQTNTIVNNESSEIIVMLNSEFNEFAGNPTLNLYPEALKEKIDSWNEKIYHSVNNGVYRCGFAQTQQAYNLAIDELFTTLDEIEAALEINRYLCGNNLTLADVRLFTTLFRFDVAYYGIFKCNRRRIQDYPNLGAYLRDIYQLPGVADTCNLESVKQDYYGNLFPLNPGGIIPSGPDMSYLLTPHDRDRIG